MSWHEAPWPWRVNPDPHLSDEEARVLRERFLAAQGEPIKVVLLTHFQPISDDMLMDEGLTPDTRPPVRIDWRSRFRWWLASRRERFGRWLGGKIAGMDLSEREDW